MLKAYFSIISVLLAISFTTYSGLTTSLERLPAPQTAKQETPQGLYEVWLYDYPMADVQVLVSSQVLAIKNRNPMNVKSIAVNEPWKGQIGTDSQGHAIFSSFSYGLRAAAMTLRSYALRYGINTVEGIVNRFVEGDQVMIDKYILYLSLQLGVDPRQKINMKKNLPKLLRFMTRYECGVIFPESLFAPYDILAEM